MAATIARVPSSDWLNPMPARSWVSYLDSEDHWLRVTIHDGGGAEIAICNYDDEVLGTAELNRYEIGELARFLASEHRST